MKLKFKNITFVKAEIINKGYSNEKKYYVETVDGKQMILQLSNMADYGNREKLFDTMRKVSDFGVPIPRPIDYGLCDSGENVYVLLEWYDGCDLEKLMPTLSMNEQYMYGIKAGKILNKIHSIPTLSIAKDWHLKFIEEKYKQLREVLNYDIYMNGGDTILQYFEENKHLIYNRPICFNHGDYHSGNLLAIANGDLIVLDWENNRYGDPWNDFMEIYNADIFPYFITGLIHGYFNGEPSPEFWKLFSLYVSSSVVACVFWAVNNSPNLIKQCVKNVEKALQSFNYMKNPVPDWYINGLYNGEVS